MVDEEPQISLPGTVHQLNRSLKIDQVSRSSILGQWLVTTLVILNGVIF